MRFASLISFLFDWWHRATWGTWIYTFRRGEFVGQDDAGNRYYQERGVPEIGRYYWNRRRRWVIYSGQAEASSVPPEWNAWLQHNADVAPTQATQDYNWEKPHVPNLTGTAAAYRPAGNLLGAGQRAQATGDYEPWQPN